MNISKTKKKKIEKKNEKKQRKLSQSFHQFQGTLFHGAWEK
jgi:hypothetical protein